MDEREAAKMVRDLGIDKGLRDAVDERVLASRGIHLNPDCRDGKHRACRGDAWDVESDSECRCGCSCHVVPQVAEIRDCAAAEAA